MNGLVWFSRLLKISQAKLVPDRHLDEALLSRSARICFSGITSGACINRYCLPRNHVALQRLAVPPVALSSIMYLGPVVPVSSSL